MLVPRLSKLLWDAGFFFFLTPFSRLPDICPMFAPSRMSPRRKRHLTRLGIISSQVQPLHTNTYVLPHCDTDPGLFILRRRLPRSEPMGRGEGGA
ncbi:uncharacterized protein LY79DRAFT_101667 [Colletotrichum navitas]|uniref:Uncharacterized protein n=1 Tax=Colletotrichum navitas TaxID=681940 RepID=A0AAD8Q4N9_9PEZI|nr:uncharacterized protein LY79DRAFT_101667 [Colletotrichum navitas]KAK1595555.1 hypothetical protein LY79DRAFT_101667 [Colletotrichum navitas]